MQMLSVEERFDQYVMPEHNSGCWLWTGGYDKDGYGRFKLGVTPTNAHRVAWELHKGPIPDGLCVLHKCDNPPCVNPDHLFIGTHKDNSEDRDRKGRRGDSFGEHNGMSRLTVVEVMEIYNSPLPNTEIAKKYGVVTTAVQRIKSGARWSHLTGAVFDHSAVRPNFTEAQVLDIYKDPRMQKDIAAEYGVDPNTIYKIKSGRRWSRITGHAA